MAWTNPASVATGDVLTAANWNAAVVGNAAELAPHFAAWTTFTPQLRTSVNNRTSTVNYARYMRVGSLLIAQASVTCTTTGGANEQVNLSLPSGFTYTAGVGDATVCGTFQIQDLGVAFYVGSAIHAVSGWILGLSNGAANRMGAAGPAMTLVNGDVVSYSVMLEVSP